MKDSFVIKTEWKKHLKLLSKEQAGDLFNACFEYHESGKPPDGDPIVQVAFSFMQQFFDDNAAKYEERVEANRRNGQSGGRPRKPKGYNGNPENPVGFSETQQKPTKAKKPDYDSGSEYDSDTVPPTEGEGKRAGKPRFTPPTLEEVAAYVAERGSPVDPQGFIDFYASKGWLVGKTPMKDWKAACRNAERWERWKRPTASERPAQKENGNVFLDMLKGDGP